MSTTASETTASLYLTQKSNDDIVLNIPATKYNLHLTATTDITPNPQGRLRGTIRLNAWKVDDVSRGGTYIEPLNGRPRRVQGTVIGHDANANAFVIEAHKTPFLVTLPDRYNATDYPLNSRVAIDTPEGATFEQAS
ncbi:MAG: hypothetical protein ACYTGQ_14380 [Planctomycetota bacterium]|jgi:hypothetical protein